MFYGQPAPRTFWQYNARRGDGECYGECKARARAGEALLSATRCPGLRNIDAVQTAWRNEGMMLIARYESAQAFAHRAAMMFTRRAALAAAMRHGCARMAQRVMSHARVPACCAAIRANPVHHETARRAARLNGRAPAAKRMSHSAFDNVIRCLRASRRARCCAMSATREAARAVAQCDGIERARAAERDAQNVTRAKTKPVAALALPPRETDAENA